MVVDEVAWLGRKAAELLADYTAHAPAARGPFSSVEIERIWAEEVLPHLPGFQSMNYVGRTPPSEDSRWWLNYTVPSSVGE